MLSPGILCFLLLLTGLLLYHATAARYQTGILLFLSIVFLCLLRWIDVLGALLTFANVQLTCYSIRMFKKKALAAGITAQVLLLLSLKYAALPAFLTLPVLGMLPKALGAQAGIVGLSFYSLQAVSLMVQHSRGELREQNARTRILYLFFFPKLLQGPVEAPEDFLPQLPGTKMLTSAALQGAVLLILTGLVKKLALADRLAPYADNVFAAAPDSTPSLVLLTGAYLFTLQLYFDFSGYTDMALGIAALFGIKLTDNFRQPLLAASMTDLWRRWHITLVAWLTEHIYTPVVFYLRSGGTKAVLAGITATFLLSGLWHGLKLSFLVWGVLHAAFVCLEFMTRTRREHLLKRLPEWLSRAGGVFLTFHLFCLANVFFRAESTSHAWEMLHGVFTGISTAALSPASLTAALAGGGEWELQLNLFFCLMLSLLMIFSESRLKKNIALNRAFVTLTVLLLLLLLVFGRLSDTQHFIYRQF